MPTNETELTSIAIGTSSPSREAEAGVARPSSDTPSDHKISCKNLEPKDVGADRVCDAVLLNGGRDPVGGWRNTDSDPAMLNDILTSDNNNGNEYVLLVHAVNQKWVDWLRDSAEVDDVFLKTYAGVAERVHERETFMRALPSDNAMNEVAVEVDGDRSLWAVKDWAISYSKIEEPFGFDAQFSLEGPCHYARHGYSVLIACYFKAPSIYIFLVESSPTAFGHQANISPFTELSVRATESTIPISLFSWKWGFQTTDWFPIEEYLTDLFKYAGRDGRQADFLFDILFRATHRSGSVPPNGESTTLPSMSEGHSPAHIGRHLLGTQILTGLLSVSVLRTNVAYLRRCLSHCRDGALQEPGMRTYEPMVILRRTITDLRKLVVRYRKNVKVTTEATFLELQSEPKKSFSSMYIQLDEDIAMLSRELNDEIHLMIGAVTVQDSSAMKQQAERATQLTLLAAIYLPLTLVTGIFGMNIKEINDGEPRFWACVAALAVTACLTLCFVLAYRFVTRIRRKRDEKEKRGDGRYKLI